MIERPAGFTLIEVLVVLVIAAVSAGIVATAVPHRGGALDVADAISDLTEALRLGRMKAIAMSRPVVFAVEPGGAGYVLDREHHALPPGVRVSMSGPPEIWFDALGGGTGGALTVRGHGAGGAILRVDWLTGRVTVETRS
jgi:general secretion pathway protein H